MNEYEGCCGAQPVEFTRAKKQIYVPNAFTPNGDGVNDYFRPYVNDEVGTVWGFTILSATGDTVLFMRPRFDGSDSTKLSYYAWNGLRKDGTRYKGLFKYRMRVDDKMANKDIIEGTACAIVCGPEANYFQSKQGCFFPAQAGENEKKGKLESARKNRETNCFK
ncbi:hypothetical protein GCM10023187_53450 [Nibrella viscosa]|uniref:Uncharacterized protein n=2 Tax=Nibrella viscosa TaxID=1084524 RepID=A0ABP8L0E8_9BACT